MGGISRRRKGINGGGGGLEIIDRALEGDKADVRFHRDAINKALHPEAVH